jgi:hypothetical protein
MHSFPRSRLVLVAAGPGRLPRGYCKSDNRSNLSPYNRQSNIFADNHNSNVNSYSLNSKSVFRAHPNNQCPEFLTISNICSDNSNYHNFGANRRQCNGPDNLS